MLRRKRSTGEHRHIACKLGGKDIDPLLLLNFIRATREEGNSKKIYSAGAVNIPDYIFCGVRFCSTDDLYKIRP